MQEVKEKNQSSSQVASPQAEVYINIYTVKKKSWANLKF